jgi:hypothetical protein
MRVVPSRRLPAALRSFLGPISPARLTPTIASPPLWVLPRAVPQIRNTGDNAETRSVETVCLQCGHISCNWSVSSRC